VTQTSKHSIFLQLKWSLQALAISADDQLSLFPDFVCKTDELMLDFDNWSATASQFGFTPIQSNVIRAIDELLTRMSRGGDLFSKELYTEYGLRNSEQWRNVRRLAKEALHEFGWLPEAPPMDRSIYMHCS
jgi:hypothetical protein